MENREMTASCYATLFLAAQRSEASAGASQGIQILLDTGDTGAPQAAILFVIGQESYTVDSNVYNIDAAPFIENGRTLVPVRYLGDAIGATTNWDGTSNTVTLTMGNTVVALVIGANNITVNGQASPLDVAPVIKDGRTYLPVSAVAEAFGYTVSWDQATQTVSLMQE